MNNKDGEKQDRVAVVPLYVSENGSAAISMLDISSAVWKGKWLILILTFIFGVSAAIVLINMTNVYTAEMTVVPSEEATGGGLTSLTGQLGGLASLTGLAPTSSAVSKDKVALEVMMSGKFIADFVRQHDYAVLLLATKSWDPISRSVALDSDIYEQSNGKWVNQQMLTDEGQPHQYILKNALLDSLAIEELKPSGLIRISFEHPSPEFAAKLVNQLIVDLNETMRIRDIRSAETTIQYLNDQLAGTQLAEMRNVFFRLIEEQHKDMMLARVQSEYVFEVVDPAVEPIVKSGPKRALGVAVFILLGAFVGFLASVMIWSRGGDN